MKKLFVILFVFVAFAASAQSPLKLTYNGAPVNHGDTIKVDMMSFGEGEDMNVFVGYANESKETYTFYVEVMQLKKANDDLLTFCVDGFCYDGSTSNDIEIEAGASVAETEENAFHANYVSADTVSGLAKFAFTNKNNTLESIEFYVYYVSPKGFFDGGDDGGSRPGVADVVKNNALRAYPNPATTNVTVEYSAGNGANLVVKSLTGSTVYLQPVDGSGKVNISTSALKSGIYFYGLERNGKMICTKKLLVK